MTRVAPSPTAHKEAGPPRVTWQEWSTHFVRLLRPYRTRLVLAHVAMLIDAGLTVLRPWPLTVVIDRVIAQKPSRVPFIGSWLDHLPLERTQILYGACLTTLLIALGTGLALESYLKNVRNIM